MHKIIFSAARDRHLLPLVLLAFASLSSFASPAFAQQTKQEKANQSLPPTQPALTRKTTRRELRRFNFGGTLVVYGAPRGSITVEPWSRPEVEIVADVELRADTEEDLAQLAAVNGFHLDEDTMRLQVLTVGTHDRKYLRRVAKNFPKRLLNADWKIDYRLRVPALVDLEIYAGRGNLTLTGTEGALAVNLTEGDAVLAPAGGDVSATVGRGAVTLRPLARSWRGRGVELRLAAGTLNLELPPSFNADFTAEVLRHGSIVNSYGALAPLNQTSAAQNSSDGQATANQIDTQNAAAPRSLRGRFGVGGAAFNFTVGDGTLRITQVTPTTGAN